MELYSRVRRACHVGGMSERAAAGHFGIDRKTVSKILKHSVPPGYRREHPPVRPKLDPFIPIINQILEEDKSRIKKQRHTARRIYERLRDEHGFTGGITIVTDYVRERRRRTREVFVPLSHAPGHAQVDFGEALGEIGGVVRKLHYFAMALPHSDAFFIKAYPAETTEAFCDGHVAGFAFFGGVPLSGLYDNTTIAVARILGDGTRQRTRTFSELQSHYLFEDRFGRPGKGNDKGNVEGTIGYGRRNFLVPMPRFDSFDDLNARLEEQCLKRQDEVLRAHRDYRRAADARPRRPDGAPPDQDACESSARGPSNRVRYRNNDYSVPVTALNEVQALGYEHDRIGCVIGHQRSYEKADGLRSRCIPTAWNRRLANWTRRLASGWDLPGDSTGCWKRAWARRASNTSRFCGLEAFEMGQSTGLSVAGTGRDRLRRQASGALPDHARHRSRYLVPYLKASRPPSPRAMSLMTQVPA